MQPWGMRHWFVMMMSSAAFSQRVSQDAVHNQVRIAPYGRSEMGIGWTGQGKVTFILFRVAGLLERAQHEIGKDALFRFSGKLLHQLLVHAGCYVHLFRQLDERSATPAAVVCALIGASLHSFY